MKSMMRVYITDDQNQKVFGEGPFRLLRGIEETGSLRAAAISMEMAYTKALKILRRAEAEFGFPLTRRAIGGRDGGGSCLTPQGKELLEKYEIYRDRCRQSCEDIYAEVFGK